MKVLHVINSMDPRMGGPTRVLAELVQQQVKAGLHVAVCTTDRGSPQSRRVDVKSISSLLGDEVALHCFPVSVTSILYSGQMRHWLRRTISHFDIVHVHGLYRFPTSYAARIARLRRVPLIIRPHGSLDPYLYERSSRSLMLKRVYERMFDLPNLRGAAAIHFTTSDEQSRAAFLNLPTPSFVIPNGINWDRFSCLPNGTSFRSRLGLGSEPLVLFLGRINFKKGLDLLIPAFARLKETVIDAQLAVVGPDSDGYRKRVKDWVTERRLADCVHFVKHLSGVDVIQAYVDADVFVLPSYTENFGMTVVEAMACGVPVVISDQVNIFREVAHYGAGIVTRCDIHELERALKDLLSDPFLRKLMGQAGRIAARQHYGWLPVVNELTKEYNAVIARSRNMVTLHEPV